MLRSLALLLIGALLLTACGGAEDTASTTEEDAADEEVAADDSADEGADEEVSADGEITDADIEAAIDQAIVEVFCENVAGFVDAFNTFQSSETGSEEESAAIDTMNQLGEEITVLAGEELPELVGSLAIFTVAAENYVAGEGDTLEGEDAQVAAATIQGAGEACAEVGL